VSSIFVSFRPSPAPTKPPDYRWFSSLRELEHAFSEFVSDHLPTIFRPDCTRPDCTARLHGQTARPDCTKDLRITQPTGLGRELNARSTCIEGMGSRRLLWIVTAFLMLIACSERAGSSYSQASARKGVSTTRPTSAPLAVTSLRGRIVFDNFHDVWSVNADGTDFTRLTRSPWPEFDPTWSPDGTQIAFRSEPHGDQEIWLMNADGSDPRRLTRGLSPTWSPDGSKIAYSSPGDIPCPPGRGLQCTGISIINADGSEQHRVPNTDGGEYPSWSPDGKRIAFNSNLSGDHVMYIVDPDGSGLVDLTSVGEGWQVDWSPDGRSILFTSHRDHLDNYTDIYVMRPDGSGVKRLTHNSAYTPAWSPDGRHIVFSAPGLYVMRADGSGMRSLPVKAVGETSLPDWVRP
jgi:dipeptidyl aminopeptidase/acylaminoacyl peptidase